MGNLSTKQELRTLKGHQDIIFDIAFLLDGKTLATASADKTVKLWDPSTKLDSTVLEGSVSDVAFSPDSKTLAGVSDDTVKLWDVNTMQELSTLRGNKEPVTTIAFSPDSKLLASAGEARYGRGARKIVGREHAERVEYSQWSQRFCLRRGIFAGR